MDYSKYKRNRAGGISISLSPNLHAALQPKNLQHSPLNPPATEAMRYRMFCLAVDPRDNSSFSLAIPGSVYASNMFDHLTISALNQLNF